MRPYRQQEWTPWTDDYDTVIFDENDLYYFQFRVQRGGTDSYGVLNISDVIFMGTFNMLPVNSTTGTILPWSSQFFEPIDTWKVFSLTGYQIVSTPVYVPANGIILLYRVSQDRGRSWTPWYYLTNDIVSYLRPDPLRFFNIQYHIINETSLPFMVSQINLLGDFINISSEYAKSNKLGIKSTCPNNNPDGSPCDTTVNPYTSLMNQKSCNPSGYWTPYDRNKSIQLYQFQAKMALDTLGWTVDYYKTDVDRKGRDVVLNEYQLFNINCVCQMKILVPGNKFPDNQIEFNGTDLSEMMNFEVHVLRDEFKNHFGINERPAIGDIVYICERNRLYRVEHAGSQRSFMNATIYYKVQLRKYNQQSNTRLSDTTAANQLKQLTTQTTFAELIGSDIQDQLRRIANKPLNANLSNDPIRDSIIAPMVAITSLQSGPNTIADYYYDMTKVPTTQFGVVYTPLDTVGDTSASRTLDVWFNLNSIGYRCNLFNNFHNGSGYSLDVDSKGVYFTINSDVYNLFVPINIGAWYVAVAIFDQTTMTMGIYLYTTIDSTGAGSDPSLQLVSSAITGLVNTYSWSSQNNMGIFGSMAYITHIRVWREAVDISVLIDELTVQKLDDAQLAIVADNVLPRVKAKSFVPTPDPQQLPDTSSLQQQKLDIVLSNLSEDGNDSVDITDHQWYNLGDADRLVYLESKYNIGISDYKFNTSNSDQMDFIIGNFTVLSDIQFNSLDDASKIIFLDRLKTNNPSGQWLVPGITPYGIIPDDVFSLMDEVVVDTVIANGWRVTTSQWPTMTIDQMYAYLQVVPRNKLVPTPPQGNTETTTQFLARLNSSFNKLQMVQSY